MTNSNPSYLRAARAALVCGLSLVLASAALAAEARKSFDIQPGDALPALKQFAAQSGEQLLYSAEAVRGVSTNAIKGKFTAREALEQMVRDTPLAVVADKKNGALSLVRDPDPNAEGVAQVAATQKNQGKVEDGKLVLDTYQVNGTRITGIINQGVIPREENQAVRFEVISRADIERTGLTDMGDLFRNSPLAQGAGTSTQRDAASFNNATGFLNQTGENLNLRGMGPNGTLVLINGRRLLSNDQFGADVSRIPLSAVERIEILPGGGGAIYGGNAVGGVINVILRTGFNSTEVGAYFGAATAGGGEEKRFDLFMGRSFNGGKTNFNLTLNHKQTGEIRQSDRDFLSRGLAAVLSNPLTSPTTAPAVFFGSFMAPLATSRPTVRATTALGIPGNPTATFAAVPVGSTGVGLTLASFDATAGQHTAGANGHLARKFVRFGPEEYAAILSADHAIFGDKLQVYTELTYRRATSDYTAPNRFANANIAASNPFNPFGRTVTVFWDAIDLPDDQQTSVKKTYRGVVGLKGRFRAFGDRNFNWALDGSSDYNTELQENIGINNGLSGALTRGIYNPFRDLTNAGRQPAAEIVKYQAKTAQDLNTKAAVLNFRINGELFEIWGGLVRFSLVGERRRDASQASQRDVSFGEYATPTPGFPADYVIRYYTGAGLETILPLVGEKNRKPWLRSFDLTVGARYEGESGFAAKTPPLAALKLAFTEDFALRVAYADGFVPPSVFNRTFGPFSFDAPGFFVVTPEDPLRPGQPAPPLVTQIFRGNPDLRPETSTTWDGGLILTPRALPGLTLTANYFRTEKIDVIAPVTTVSFTDTALFFPSFILRDAPSAADTAAGRPGPVNTFISSAHNFGRLFTDGIDFKFSYDFPTQPLGQFRIEAAYTWTKRFDVQATATSATLSQINIDRSSGFGVIKQDRATATVSWKRDRWAASLTGKYADGFEHGNSPATPFNPTGSGRDPGPFPSTLTFDSQISYQIPLVGGASGLRSWLGGTKWSLGALNLLNKEPALTLRAGSAFYDTSIDARLRFVYLQVKKNF